MGWAWAMGVVHDPCSRSRIAWWHGDGSCCCVIDLDFIHSLPHSSHFLSILSPFFRCLFAASLPAERSPPCSAGLGRTMSPLSTSAPQAGTSSAARCKRAASLWPEQSAGWEELVGPNIAAYLAFAAATMNVPEEMVMGPVLADVSAALGPAVTFQVGRSMGYDGKASTCPSPYPDPLDPLGYRYLKPSALGVTPSAWLHMYSYCMLHTSAPFAASQLCAELLQP
jgi:hypothetical protein